MSYEKETAEALADRAKQQFGPDHQTDALGEGLAAVAYALLDVAAAIRELAEAQNQPS